MSCIRKNSEDIPPVNALLFRYDVNVHDPERIRHLTKITGFFHAAEVAIAGELAEECLAGGIESGYFFVIAEYGGELAGYSCYGKIPCTQSSYDLYWIAVHPDFQGKGFGKKILKETERLIRESLGTRIYVETSRRQQYSGTRAFYERCGYRLESLLKDFYAPGDDKATYCKSFADMELRISDNR